jgi:6-phospho-beta-glucosidase
MKVVVLGGSTPHTVGLVEALLDQGLANDPPLQLMLVGRKASRLEAVAGFCSRRIQAAKAEGRFSLASSINPAEASQDADLFVFQVRPGGLQGRDNDETFPLAYGIPGDEGLGPGGLASALRNFKIFRSLLPALKAAPKAPILMLTNPLGLSGRWFQEHHAGPVIGVCELPIVTLEQALGHSTNPETDAAYAGLNHQGFWFRMRQGSRDVLSEALAKAPKWMHHPEACGTLPLSYWRLYFDRSSVIQEQKSRISTRAASLIKLCHQLEAECRAGDGTSPLPSESSRPKPWYSRVVAPMLLARLRSKSLEIYANCAAGPGHLFATPHCQVERRMTWNTPKRQPQEGPPPPKLLPILKRVALTDEAAWHACSSGSFPRMLETLDHMLLCSHLSSPQKHELADKILHSAEGICV